MDFLPFPRGQVAHCDATGNVTGSTSFLNEAQKPLLDAIQGESVRAQVLIVCAFLDNVLKRCVSAQFEVYGLTKTLVDKLIGSDYSLLGSFAARMDFGRALNLFDNEEHGALTALRKIRNRFTHADFAVEFTDKKVEPHVQTLERWLRQVEGRACYVRADGQRIPSWVVDLASAGQLKEGDKIDSRHVYLAAALMLYTGLVNVLWKIKSEEYDGALLLQANRTLPP